MSGVRPDEQVPISESRHRLSIQQSLADLTKIQPIEEDIGD